jgi:two-component system, cell cycle response regulator CtrA
MPGSYATGGSVDLLIGVTSSIPCLSRVKGRKGGSNLMGANVARVHREPIPFPHRCGLLRPRGLIGALPDRLQALLTMWVANVPGPVARKRIAMRVLLIEDDSATAQSIELMLKSESFNFYTTDLGEEGVDLGKLYDYDIILLDLNLPDMSGYEVLRMLRVSKVKTLILILTGLGGIEDKVRGLGYGADDYMTKPFHKDELVARIHAIVRRSKGHAQSVVQTGDLVVNLDTKTVEVGGARVHLTGKEYQRLELLSLRKGTTLTKEMFLNNLYGGMDEPEIKIIDVFICKLRKKLASASDGKDYIETVWGRGYVLREPSEEEARISA